MDMKEPWLEYITKVADLGPLEDAFAKFRIALKDAGFKEEDLLAVSEAPREVFSRRFQVVQRIDDLRSDLKNTLYGTSLMSKKTLIVTFLVSCLN